MSKVKRWSQFTQKEIRKWRARGYHLHSCWKCGGQWFSLNGKTWLPAKKEYRYICRICKAKMGLEV